MASSLVCIATSCVQTRISSPVSLCLLAFPAVDLEKRGLIQTASGGVNFLQSHFALFIAAMPECKQIVWREAAGILPCLRKNAQPVVHCTEMFIRKRVQLILRRKSIEHNLKKTCFEKTGLIGWKPGYFQKVFPPLRVYYSSELEALPIQISVSAWKVRFGWEMLDEQRSFAERPAAFLVKQGKHGTIGQATSSFLRE